MPRPAGATAVMAVLGAVAAPTAPAGSAWIPDAGGIVNVPVTSIFERRFEQVVRQQYDFSCGSAAVATLLTYHYDDPTAEQDAFRSMYENGDQEKIRKSGFSLLDMKKYLEGSGYQADGYQASLDTLQEVGVAAIALINYRGYRHFVVVKGVQDGEVLVGDPALGMRFMPRPEFESMWDNGILFIIRNRPEVGRENFNASDDWRLVNRAPLGLVALSQESLASLTVNLPRIGEF